MPSQAPEKPTSLGDQVNMGYGILSSVCACVTPPIRCDFGINGIGLRGVFGLAIMLSWAAFYPCPEMIYYIGFWLFCVAIQRIATLWQHHRGTRQLTIYDGYPYLALTLVPFLGESAAKILVEPLIVGGSGLLVNNVSEGIGHFLMIGAVAIPIKQLFERRLIRAADDAMIDAQEMMRQQALRMRSRR